MRMRIQLLPFHFIPFHSISCSINSCLPIVINAYKFTIFEILRDFFGINMHILRVHASPTYRLYRLYNEGIVVCFGYYKFTKMVTLLPGDYNHLFSWRANMWERAPLHAFLTALLQKCILIYATVIVIQIKHRLFAAEVLLPQWHGNGPYCEWDMGRDYSIFNSIKAQLQSYRGV